MDSLILIQKAATVYSAVYDPATALPMSQVLSRRFSKLLPCYLSCSSHNDKATIHADRVPLRGATGVPDLFRSSS